MLRCRDPLRQGEREVLAAAARRIEAEGRAAQEAAAEGELLRRRAVRQALEGLGLLVIRWRRFSPAISEGEGDIFP